MILQLMSLIMRIRFELYEKDMNYIMVMYLKTFMMD